MANFREGSITTGHAVAPVAMGAGPAHSGLSDRSTRLRSLESREERFRVVLAALCFFQTRKETVFEPYGSSFEFPVIFQRPDDADGDHHDETPYEVLQPVDVQ